MDFEDPGVILSHVAAVASLALGAAALLQHRRSVASWCFVAGMATLSVESFVTGLALRASDVDSAIHWQSAVLLAKSFTVGIWLAFSLSYSRGNYREFLKRSRLALLLACVVPPAIALIFFGSLLSPETAFGSESAIVLTLSWPAIVLNVILLLGFVLILANFERTFRAAVGTMRWRLKFLLLGLGLVFGTRLYTGSQVLLFSSLDTRLADLDSGSLLIGCVLITVGHLRHGLSEVDVYPSHALLRNSVTILLAGIYLFAIGCFAQVVKWLGGSSLFHLQALIILAGVAGLGLILFSERFRQRVSYFVSRHFRRPHHDFRVVWAQATAALIRAGDAKEACAAITRILAQNLNALSVTIWLLDDRNRWILGASTAARAVEFPDGSVGREMEAVDVKGIATHHKPFDLEEVKDPWAMTMRDLTNPQFSEQRRHAVILRAREYTLGVAVLGDRVYRMAYSAEDDELLKCLAGQLSARLLNLRLGESLAYARELETFQTMSAFFVHDLKNSASSLTLMLQNLPRHFDNPEFREDALRTLKRTTARINDLISRINSFRDKLDLDLRPADLNQLVDEVLRQSGPASCTVEKDLHLKSMVSIDTERFRSVVTNLISNAFEATPPEGHVTVRTEESDSRAILTVSDTGCGMSETFLRKSLFRPFQTTKKRGIGIGMFQSRMIVEAHKGLIDAQSAPGRGTTFRVSLPLSNP